MNAADNWLDDCSDSVGLTLWLTLPPYYTASRADLEEAVFSFAKLSGPVRNDRGWPRGAATLATGDVIGCSVEVWGSGEDFDPVAACVTLPEAGFARLLPPWPYGDEKFGAHLAIIETAEVWLDELTRHVQAQLPVTPSRSDDM
jgi:hypothetical protein